MLAAYNTADPSMESSMEPEIGSQEVGAGGSERKATPFPLGLVEKVSTYLSVKAIKEVLLASSKLYQVMDRNAVIWKKLCNTQSSRKALGCSSLAYKQRIKEEYMMKRSWALKWNERAKTVKYSPSVEVTLIRIYNELVFTASNSPLVKIWDAGLNLLQTLEGHRGSVWALDYRDNLLVTGSTDRTIRVWDCFLGIAIHVLLGHTSTVRCIRIIEHYVISGSRDRTLRVWETKSGKCVHVLRGHRESVRTIDVSEAKGLLVSGSYDGSCILWNYRKGEGLRHIGGHSRRVYIVRIFKDLVFTGGQDRLLNVCKLDGSHASRMCGHDGTIFEIERDRDGHMYSVSSDGSLCKWNISRSKLVFKTNINMRATCFNITNNLVVVGGSRGVALYDAESGKYIRHVVEGVDCVHQIQASPSHLFIAYGANGETHLSALAYDTVGLKI